MRKLTLTGLAAGLIVPAGAWAQEPAPGLERSPTAEVAIPAGSDAPRAGPQLQQGGPQPGDPAPPPPPRGAQSGGPPPADIKAKPKAKLDEAAGGLAGSVLGQVAGAAAGGPVGGIAAGMVGGRVGSGVVRMVKRAFGVGKKPAEPPIQQAAAAPQAGVEVSAREREPGPADGAPEPPEPALGEATLGPS